MWFNDYNLLKMKIKWGLNLEIISIKIKKKRAWVKIKNFEVSNLKKKLE